MFKLNKWGIALVLIICLTLSFLSLATAYTPIKLVVNGKTIQTDSSPEILWNKVYVPIRVVAEALGADVKWDSQNRTVIINSKFEPVSVSSTIPNNSTVQAPIQNTNNQLSHNQTVSYAEWDYKITKVEKHNTMLKDFNDTSIAQGKYVAIIVDVKNNAPYERELGSRFFIVKDDKGRTFNMDSTASLGYHQAFETKNWHLDDIGSSFSATIPIVFDIPLDAKNLLLYPKDGVGKVNPILITEKI